VCLLEDGGEEEEKQFVPPQPVFDVESESIIEIS
jgi:hypothetical protein